MRLAAAFAWFGLFWGSFAVATFDLERFLQIGNARFGGLLTLAVGAGIVANLGGGAVARRWGAQPTLVRAVLAFSALELLLAAIPFRALFAAVFVVSVGFSGLVDLSINVSGTARFVHEPGKLARLHGVFNTGALVGAAVMALLLAGGHSWRWGWAAFGALGLPIALWSRSDVTPAGTTAEGAASPLVLWRQRLVLLGLAFCLAALVEGGLDTWGVLYLRANLALSALAGGAGYALGQALAAAARIWLGPRAGRLGGAGGAAAGAALAAAGLALEAGTSGPAAAAGLALAVLGISLCWPLFMAAAGRAGGSLPAVIGAMVAVGYLGFLVGPSLIGWIAGLAGLRAGMLTIAVLAAISAATAASWPRSEA